MVQARSRILIIEDSPMQVRVIGDMLSESSDLPYDLESAGQLEDGLARLAQEHFDAVLLDLTLPDSMGLETFLTVNRRFPQLPVVVLSSSENVELSIRAVQKGAQDYLVKGHVSSSLLSRALRYAIERHNMQALFKNMALVDELTGLHNRRAFFGLAQEAMKSATEQGQGCLFVMADLDGLKRINDTHGHQEGDFALMAAAATLKMAFGPQDILARIGGDEFGAVVSPAVPEKAGKIVTTLQAVLEAKNARKNRRPYDLSLSIGIAYFDPQHPVSIDQVLAQADRAMYANKNHKHQR